MSGYVIHGAGFKQKANKQMKDRSFSVLSLYHIKLFISHVVKDIECSLLPSGPVRPHHKSLVTSHDLPIFISMKKGLTGSARRYFPVVPSKPHLSCYIALWQGSPI